MRAGALAFALAFSCSALAGLVGAGCFGGACDCSATPERPTPQGPLSWLGVRGFDAEGNTAELEVKPENGTLEVTTDAVIVRYRQDAAEHEIRYRVAGRVRH
jgi:hypothetical protein